jgi:ketosteroid isomerase-like protein
MAIWMRSFDDDTAELREVRDEGDRVVCLAEQIGKIEGTKAPVRQRLAIVCSDFRDGTIGEMRFFRSSQEPSAPRAPKQK